jgi:hypothetical protein
MPKSDKKRKHFSALVRLSTVTAVVLVLTEAAASAQTSPLSAPLSVLRTFTFQPGSTPARLVQVRRLSTDWPSQRFYFGFLVVVSVKRLKTSPRTTRA